MAERTYNPDLPRHAANKVKRALDDVLQLVDDPTEMLRISVMAASIPIGAASGFLAAEEERAGNKVSQTEAIVAILDMLKNHFVKTGASEQTGDGK